MAVMQPVFRICCICTVSNVGSSKQRDEKSHIQKSLFFYPLTINDHLALPLLDPNSVSVTSISHQAVIPISIRHERVNSQQIGGLSLAVG